MRIKRSAALVSLLLAGPLGAAEPVVPSSASAVGACQESGGCPAAVSSSAAVVSSTPTWRLELQKTQVSKDACQADIDQFCEGVQVGQGRLKKCLKAHRSKLSLTCRTAEGL